MNTRQYFPISSPTTRSDPTPEWPAAMLRLHEIHGAQILGCCCGTTTAHMKALAESKS